MESLLSLAFDNLSSYDGIKIKKGLKQVEGLLAQICLSGPSSSSSSSRQSTANPPGVQSSSSSQDSPKPPRKALADLSSDPAFREFFKLQDGFEWNIAQRLLPTLDWLVARGGDGQYDLLIVNALDLIQGVLLLHPPSKVLFSRTMHMNLSLPLPSKIVQVIHMPTRPTHKQLLLDLIEPVNCPAVQSATIITLVVALLDSPQNTRVFERLDGLLTITSLFKDPDTVREVKFRLTEFLYFYLTPEIPSIPKASSSNQQSNGLLQRSPSKLIKAFGGGGGRDRSVSESNGTVLSVDTKKHYVDRYLPGVVDLLVKDLDTYKPFGGILS